MKEKNRHSTQTTNQLYPTDEFCDDEIDLARLFALLWHRRIIIVGIVLLCTFLASVYCLIATPLFEINAQVQPGITGYDSKGDEIRGITPEAIKFWFSKKGYASIENNDTDSSHSLGIKAVSKRNSKIVDITFYWPDKRQGIAILQKVLQAFSDTLGQNMHKEIEINRKKLEEKISRLRLQLQQTLNMITKLEGQIKQKKNNIQLLETTLITLNRNKAQMEKARDRIKQQVKTVYANTNELIELRKEMIKLGSKAGVDKFALLMYSNIVQQNITYITSLEQRLATIEKEINEFLIKEEKNKGEIDDIKIDIKNLASRLEKEIPLRQKALEKQIAIIQAQEAALGPIEIVQAPFSSPKPVKPRSKLIVILSVFLGLLLAIFIVLIMEFWNNSKAKFHD